jgi:radical SAM superfamily enzyme YgiQ (UPF0313 family)
MFSRGCPFPCSFCAAGQTRIQYRGGESARLELHGFPGENDQTTDDTISLLAELAPDLARVSLFRFVPLPGTQVYANPDAYGVTGTHMQPGWDGDWSAFHIHHNTRRWWGTDAQWAEVESSYRRLHDFVEVTWGPQS